MTRGRACGLLAMVVLAALAGCAAPDPATDGLSHVVVHNQGEPVYLALVGEEGTIWSRRLLPNESTIIEVAVPPGRCVDLTLFAGWHGREPHVPIRLIAPCDEDREPHRVDVAPPRPPDE